MNMPAEFFDELLAAMLEQYRAAGKSAAWLRGYRRGWELVRDRKAVGDE